MGTGQTADFDSCICRMFRTSAISFVIADAKSPDCPIIFASPSFYDSTGYSPDKGLRWATVSPSQRATTNANNTVLGRNCRFLQGPKTSRRKVSEIRDALREDRSCSVCLLNYRRDGSAFWNQFYLAPLRDDQGHVSLYIGVQCDVSAAVQAACAGQDDPDGLLESFHSSAEPTAEALEHALRSYSIDDVLFSVTGEAFPPARAGSSSSGGCAPGCTHDCSVGQMPTSLLGPLLRIQSSYVLSDPALPDCPIVHASDSFLRMTGYPREEVVGRNCRFLQGPATDQEEVVKIRKALSAEPPQAVTVTLVNYRRDGSPFFNCLHVAPIRDAKGKVRFFAGVQIDLGDAPEHAAGEDAAEAATPRARDKLKHKSCVAAVRVAVRSLADGGLRRSHDYQRVPE